MTAEVRSAVSTGESPPSVLDGVAGQGLPGSDGAAFDRRAGSADGVVPPDADGVAPNGAVPPDVAPMTGARPEDAVPDGSVPSGAGPNGDRDRTGKTAYGGPAGAGSADRAAPHVDVHADGAAPARQPADHAASHLDGRTRADGFAGKHPGAAAGETAAEQDPAQDAAHDQVEATVAGRLGALLDDDLETDPAGFAASAVLDVLRAAGWADAGEAAELRAESERLRELLNMVVRDHRAREASAAGMGDQQLQWLIPLLRAAHGVAFGSLGAKVALRTAVQDVPPDVLAKAGLRIDYGVEPASPDSDQPAGY